TKKKGQSNEEIEDYILVYSGVSRSERARGVACLIHSDTKHNLDDGKIEKTENIVNEVNKLQTVGGERGDRQLVGQVVTSVGPSDHHGSEIQRLAASKGQTDNQPPELRAQPTADGEDRNGTPDEYQWPETLTDQVGKANSEVEIEERIIGKITHKIQAMMECIKQMVEDEIAIEHRRRDNPGEP
ncbi:hypothetical protein C0J52_13094, partial [Blattella germanica]